jgi:hypothetical protein
LPKNLPKIGIVFQKQTPFFGQELANFAVISHHNIDPWQKCGELSQKYSRRNDPLNVRIFYSVFLNSKARTKG